VLLLEKKDGNENLYPWGSDKPIPGYHGNFDFYSLSPCSIGLYPAGKSEFGVEDFYGNGFEWTSTLFNRFDGFEITFPSYTGYSADFFDGKHYVLKGASYATTTPLIRRSFRNWFQAHYSYVFSKFRLVSSA